MNDIRKITANRLTTLCNRLGITQEEVSNILGVTTQTVKLMEAGRRDIAPKYIDLLRQEYGLPAFFFFADNYNEESIYNLITYMTDIGGSFKQSVFKDTRFFAQTEKQALIYLISFLSNRDSYK